MSARTNLGVLGHDALASVDGGGAVAFGRIALDWFVGADDRWHLPAAELSTRQMRTGAAPVVETSVRVPGGDVAQQAYGVAVATGMVVVVDIENRSPVPLTVALTAQIDHAAAVDLVGSILSVDDAPVLVVSRPPGAWAAGAAAAPIVTSGAARTGPVDTLRAPIELALLFPVPHRTRIRAALGDVGTLEHLRDLPDADAISRGWERQLERGLQVVLPPPIGDGVDAARADLLLAPRRSAGVVAALEDWGFDDEAASGWAGLGWRARRAARRRVAPAAPWSEVRGFDAAADPAGFLSALRSTLVRERPGAVELLPGFPPEWLGQSVTVDALPLRAGSLSFALRWHGARPALLWDAPEGVELRIPALDPAFASSAAVGETLLAEPPTSLLPMGTRERSSGEPVDAPGQFS